MNSYSDTGSPGGFLATQWIILGQAISGSVDILYTCFQALESMITHLISSFKKNPSPSTEAPTEPARHFVNGCSQAPTCHEYEPHTPLHAHAHAPHRPHPGAHVLSGLPPRASLLQTATPPPTPASMHEFRIAAPGGPTMAQAAHAHAPPPPPLHGVRSFGGGARGGPGGCWPDLEMGYVGGAGFQRLGYPAAPHFFR